MLCRCFSKYTYTNNYQSEKNTYSPSLYIYEWNSGYNRWTYSESQIDFYDYYYASLWNVKKSSAILF